MARLKLCDGRSQLYQWDTGVQIEICGCKATTECHFAIASGVIRRDVVNGICDVPDAALQQAGLLTIYAFTRDGEEGSTRHEFKLRIVQRPKPADYIDPPDESNYIDQIAERVVKLGGGGGSGGSALPPVTEEDNGKVLIVEDGAWRAGNLPAYDGDYEIAPSAHEAVVLETAKKLMQDNVTVKQIPAYEVSNATGGNTFYIASEVQ